MFVKQIKLKNFQKHSDLTLDFKSGVNIIYGRSDVGKSCIRRAIQWVLWNEKIDGVRKTGTKETSVFILLDSGVAIEKVRSTSINRYIIHKDGKETKFDAINKSVPDEVKDLIGINPMEIDGQEIYLNATPQIGLPFLFDISPHDRMKLFNKLTGNDLLDKLFVQFNKDILGLNRDLKETKLTLEEQLNGLQTKEIEKEKLEAKFKKSKKDVEDVDAKFQKYSKLFQINELYTGSLANLAVNEERLKSIKYPQDVEMKQLMDKIEVLKVLNMLQDALEQNKVLDKVVAQLAQINVPELNLAEETRKIERLDKLNEICYTYNEKDTQREGVAHKLKSAEKDILAFENEFKSLLKEAKVCPLCFTEITEAHIEEIKI